MSIDEQHIALPKLYGAPAYARPVATVATSERPFDPDDLPIEADMTDEEREFASSLPARAWAPGGGRVGAGNGNGNGHTSAELTPRSFSLRAIAGKLLGD